MPAKKNQQVTLLPNKDQNILFLRSKQGKIIKFDISNSENQYLYVYDEQTGKSDHIYFEIDKKVARCMVLLKIRNCQASDTNFKLINLDIGENFEYVLPKKRHVSENKSSGEDVYISLPKEHANYCILESKDGFKFNVETRLNGEKKLIELNFQTLKKCTAGELNFSGHKINYLIVEFGRLVEVYFAYNPNYFNAMERVISSIFFEKKLLFNSAIFFFSKYNYFTLPILIINTLVLWCLLYIGLSTGYKKLG